MHIYFEVSTFPKPVTNITRKTHTVFGCIEKNTCTHSSFNQEEYENLFNM